MGSVASTNPAVSNLLDTLTNLNSPVMSMPSAVSALQDASPSDVAELSDEAAQLQEVTAIFGDFNGSGAVGLPGNNNETTGGNGVLEALQPQLLESQTGPTSSTEPTTESLLNLIG